MPEAQATIDVGVAPERFFAVVTDYARYPEFISSMREAHLHPVSDPDAAEVEFCIEVVRRLRYTIQIVTEAPTTVRWHLVKGELMKENTGRWDIAAGDSAESTRATYTLKIALKGLIPSAVTTQLVEQHLPEMLAEFKARAESLG